MAAQILPGESCPVEVQDVQVCRRDAPGLAWRIIDIVCGHEQPPADHRKLSQRKVDRVAFAAMRRRANDGTAGLPQSLIEPSRSASAARADSGWRALNCGSPRCAGPPGPCRFSGWTGLRSCLREPVPASHSPQAVSHRIASRRIASRHKQPDRSIERVEPDDGHGRQFAAAHAPCRRHAADTQPGRPPAGFPLGALSQPIATARALFRKARNIGSQGTIFEAAL